MAVEARRMNLLPSQFIIPNNRDFIKQNQGIVDICNNHNKTNTQMAPATETPGLLPYAALPPETVNNFAMYDWGKAESGLTSNNFPTVAPSRKRTRRSVYDEPGGSFPGRLLDEEIINSHIQQQQSEIDRFIAIHREKVRMEMEVRKKRESGMLVRAIEERVVKKLKEKEEEIERMGKLNWVLQERVKRLCIENQVWRDLAESNEATVNSLRSNLEQVMLAANNNVVAAAEEAESSCGSTSDCGRRGAEEEEESGGGGGAGGGRCRKCGAGESRVLVLPCRHLCLCTMCGSTLHTCPVCNSAINASVHVNFS
ncbi:BOI-related E3 ubiquitin-protein ligase 1-like [Benincasa hispida]|uniref:BOI-related E3 ubiquitin-protein ligase 1-like n=1 Tax=Benincasa hispida TaxID=102211 RepID=UPI001900F32A|nr:BOI-related E3 ubiquitin-protein ligase 1-like [Benincasa hispida]